MSKTLIRNKEMVGYLPWSTSYLGCIRWTSLPNFDADDRPAVVFDSLTPRIEFESQEVCIGDIINLPEFTKKDSRFSEPKQISWELGENNTTCKIKNHQIIVGGSVEEIVELTAIVDEIEIQQFCIVVIEKPPSPLEKRLIQIEENVENPTTVKIKVLAGLPKSLTSGLQIHNIIESKYRINNSPWKKTESHNITRKSQVCRCKIEAELSDFPVLDSAEITVHFTADDDRTYQLTREELDISEKLQLNNLRPEVSIDPENIELEDVFLQQDSSEFSNIINLQITGNKTGIDLQCQYPSGSVDFSIPSNKLPHLEPLPISWKKLAEWLKSNGYNDVEVSFTPFIAGIPLDSLTSRVTIKIDKEEEPMIHRNNTDLRSTSWEKFLSISPSQIEQIAENHDISNLSEGLENILQDEDEIIKTRFRRRQIFRAIRKSSEVDPLTINDNTKKFFDNIFFTDERKPLEIGLRKQEYIQEGKIQKIPVKNLIKSYYPDGQKEFDPQEGRLLSLGPRQMFNISGIKPKPEEIKFYSIDHDYHLTKAPVLRDYGNRFQIPRDGYQEEENIESLKKSGVGFRPSNSDFIAPETPGLYLLQLSSCPPIEIEVLGSKEGALPFH